jgi:hypothetical protein
VTVLIQFLYHIRAAFSRNWCFATSGEPQWGTCRWKMDGNVICAGGVARGSFGGIDFCVGYLNMHEMTGAVFLSGVIMWWDSLLACLAIHMYASTPNEWRVGGQLT